MTETASRGARNRDKVYATLALIIAAAAVYASVDIAFSGGISGTDYPVWADKMQIPSSLRQHHFLSSQPTSCAELGTSLVAAEAAGFAVGTDLI